MSKTFFTSDWHIGHHNSIKFDKRPFRDLNHMHGVLVNNYNSVVSREDTVYFLGDVGTAFTADSSSLIHKLEGTKVLVLGNHDKKSNRQWLNAGFKVVLNMAAITVGKQLVTMTHCPLRGIKREEVAGMRGAVDGENWHGESKHHNFSLPDFGQFHLHGHIHSRKDKPGSKKILGRQMDVGVVANNYRPVSFSQVESWIAKTLKEEQDD